MTEENWFTEITDTDQHPRALALQLRYHRVLESEQTPFQKLEILETLEFGKMLLLDGCVMVTEGDEFVYHDMIAHVPACFQISEGLPLKQALVIGGGDGGTVRELLKHPSLERIVLCEIDSRVVDLSRRHFPKMTRSLDDPRVEVVIGDGIEFIRTRENAFDLICVDSTDPVGPAVGLFNRSFYESAHRALTKDGVLTAQSETAWYRMTIIREVQKILKDLFPFTSMYQAAIPTYPSGTWCFAIASKSRDPLSCLNPGFPGKIPFRSRYYNAGVHQGAFQLPTWIQEQLKESR